MNPISITFSAIPWEYCNWRNLRSALAPYGGLVKKKAHGERNGKSIWHGHSELFAGFFAASAIGVFFRGHHLCLSVAGLRYNFLALQPSAFNIRELFPPHGYFCLHFSC